MQVHRNHKRTTFTWEKEGNQQKTEKGGILNGRRAIRIDTGVKTIGQYCSQVSVHTLKSDQFTTLFSFFR